MHLSGQFVTVQRPLHVWENEIGTLSKFLLLDTIRFHYTCCHMLFLWELWRQRESTICRSTMRQNHNKPSLESVQCVSEWVVYTHINSRETELYFSWMFWNVRKMGNRQMRSQRPSAAVSNLTGEINRGREFNLGPITAVVCAVQ